MISLSFANASGQITEIEDYTDGGFRQEDTPKVLSEAEEQY